jgi:DNA-directed RNA polymerase specialized sigma24 family protein
MYFLSAWLYQVTRRTAINVVRGELRRPLLEQVAGWSEKARGSRPNIKM